MVGRTFGRSFGRSVVGFWSVGRSVLRNFTYAFFEIQLLERKNGQVAMKNVKNATLHKTLFINNDL